jgi:polyisoprenoid-binding protein YceI
MAKISWILFLLLFAFSTEASAADRYEFDKSHTNILFFVAHMGFSEMVGRFTDFDGGFTFDPKAPTQSTIDVTLKPSGIKTSSEGLDEHLQKPEFFNTEKFPEIHFVSTSIKVTGDKTGDVMGNVTMLGVTKPVVLHVTLRKADFRPMIQDFAAGFHAEATIKRSDFGMQGGIPLVGDDVRLLIETEGVNVDLKARMKKNP